MNKILTLFFAVFLCAAPIVAQQHKGGHPAEGPAPIHNGLWWQNKSSVWREGFMTGYKSGSAHGAGHPLDINSFPASELIDGVDHFYKDFRNNNILVDDALTYVQDQLKGVPDDKLNAEILKMRASDAPTNVE